VPHLVLCNDPLLDNFNLFCLLPGLLSLFECLANSLSLNPTELLRVKLLGLLTCHAHPRVGVLLLAESIIFSLEVIHSEFTFLNFRRQHADVILGLATWSKMLVARCSERLHPRVIPQSIYPSLHSELLRLSLPIHLLHLLHFMYDNLFSLYKVMHAST